MDVKRRDFLRIAGLGAGLGIGGQAVWEVVKGDDVLASTHREKTEGKRWAMVVETAKCRAHDCTDCITICHKIHNVPHFDDPKREVKWIWRQGFEGAFPDQFNEFLDEDITGGSVPLMCNHCDNPGCVKVCPTGATFKREDGIVVIDMHRCIGCRYCMAGCPYGSRSFNWQDPRKGLDRIDPEYPTRTKGVVEKCTFCSERLAVGKLPACVEACPYKALTFGDLADKGSDVRKALKGVYAIRRKQSLGLGPSIFYIV
ncbi:MAG: 4Fe-4S dicluster domain-containing protein [Deltaproteobacteria bacterium]|nr:4Fe-4S dicluster domain-containing protein [Deltaproteobacteria bacterium]